MQLDRATWQNLGLAAVVGLVIGVSPHTSGHRVLPSILGGVIAFAAVLFVAQRRTRRRSPAAGPGGAPRPALTPVAWAVLAAFAAVALPVLVGLYERWTLSIWFDGHGLFVPFVVGYLAWRTLRDDRGPAESSALGFAFLVPGLGLIVYDAAIQTHFVAALGLALCLPGLALLFLGRRRTAALWLPLLLAFFIIPVPRAAATTLQMPVATALLTEPMIEVFGIPALRVNTIFLLPTEVFAVTDGCSGIAIFVASMAIAIFLAAHARSWPRRLLLLLAPWPIVVFLSAIRCALMIVAAHEYGLGILHLATHGVSGIIAFWVSVGALLLFADWPKLREDFA